MEDIKSLLRIIVPNLQVEILAPKCIKIILSLKVNSCISDCFGFLLITLQHGLIVTVVSFFQSELRPEPHFFVFTYHEITRRPDCLLHFSNIGKEALSGKVTHQRSLIKFNCSLDPPDWYKPRKELISLFLLAYLSVSSLPFSTL